MRRRKFTTLLLAICAVFAMSVSLLSCGTIHSHWGVEHEYYFPDGDHHHHRPKPKKHKKHKKYKPKKHHKHHHHDDDDDD
ncbi:hypothetical protein [Duncaniella muricolitica]|jgi:hypothetical protein|uniref:hypothetical protein n=1 Tax=Duncaniella muricolitica TaxID=2880704 RepID=UPI00244E45AD|nr:hypothetical protein [Duncaniella muricolitica]